MCQDLEGYANSNGGGGGSGGSGMFLGGCGGVRHPPKVVLFCNFLAPKLHENKRIWTPRGRPCAPPWIRQWGVKILFGKLFPKKLHENERHWTNMGTCIPGTPLNLTMDWKGVYPSLSPISLISIQFLRIIGQNSRFDPRLWSWWPHLKNAESTTASKPCEAANTFI